MPGPERRLAAILFSDIVGYTALMARDEAAGLRARERHRSLLGAQAGRYHGEVVDENGDELVLCFPSAVEAVNCALATQAELADANQLQLRIGIHTGDVVFEEGRVYGDGVNVASRVRPHAEPGGVCVSQPVHDSVKNQPNVGATSLGEQEFKNVARPLEVFALHGAAAEPSAAATRSGRSRLRLILGSVGVVIAVLALGLWVSWPRPLGLALDLTGAGQPPVEPPLPEKPSIVVLPFVTMSADPEQEYFADGITEDLTTELSRNGSLFVISRNSAFTYKGKAVKVEDVSRELGVRYVLEGSVRKAGGRVRITTQLIDATNGFHLWSERYDRELADIFTLQSELAEELQTKLQVEIRQAEMARVRRGGTKIVEAYDAMLRGMLHFERTRREDNLEARRWFRRAYELDASFGSAHAMYGNTHVMEYTMGWNRNPVLLARAEESARRALALGDQSADAFDTIGNVHIARREFGEAVSAYERAIAAEPSHDIPHLMRGVALAAQGRFLPALSSVGRGLRLNPKGRSAQWVIVGFVNYRAGRFAKALDLMEQARGENPDLVLPRLMLMYHRESEGRIDEAGALATEVLRINPDLTAAEADRMLFAIDAADAFRRSGLP